MSNHKPLSSVHRSPQKFAKNWLVNAIGCETESDHDFRLSNVNHEKRKRQWVAFFAHFCKLLTIVLLMQQLKCRYQNPVCINYWMSGIFPAALSYFCMEQNICTQCILWRLCVLAVNKWQTKSPGSNESTLFNHLVLIIEDIEEFSA